jgi:hypothetical protein
LWQPACARLLEFAYLHTSRQVTYTGPRSALECFSNPLQAYFGLAADFL